MANIDHKPSKYLLNLLHVLPPFANPENNVINVIVEIPKGSRNKLELITEAGTLKLDRVSYSSLVPSFTYGAIPCTLDLDNDPLDAMIVEVTEEVPPGTLVEARVIGLVRFTDSGERDDKIICVIDSDKRVEHIKSYQDLGEHVIKEIKYYWEHYKDLKKPGTCIVEDICGIDEAINVIKECAKRYDTEYKQLVE